MRAFALTMTNLTGIFFVTSRFDSGTYPATRSATKQSNLGVARLLL